MTEKLFGGISLCRKAGKLVAGGDASEDAARSRKAALILVTADLSERSARRMRAVSEESGVPLLVLPRTMAELAPYVGKDYGIFAVCDKGFARMIGDAAAVAGPCLNIDGPTDTD